MSIKRLFRVLPPDYWIMVDPYSAALDRFINASLDAGHIPERVDRFYVKFNGQYVWVQNFPYGYAEVRGRRPSRITIARFCDAVEYADYGLTGAAA